MKDVRPAWHADQGAVLVHVAMALLAITAFSSFAIDYGVLLVSRRQAQNVADSAALSGAISFAFEARNPSGVLDTSSSGSAALAAADMVKAGRVWGQAPVGDVFLGAAGCPSGYAFDKDCVRVDVYRNQAHGNPLPVFFGGLVGLSSQNVRATATARAAAANASDCLKPWAVADKWREYDGAPLTLTSTFDSTGPTPDVYVPQNGTSDAGTGFLYSADYGVPLTLKTVSAGPITPGWFQPLDLDGAGGGPSAYEADISGCVGVRIKVGDEISTVDAASLSPSYTSSGVADLVALDPGAQWISGAVVGSCVNNPPCPGGATYQFSPRLVSVPVFDLGYYVATGGPGVGKIRVVNILGFFVKGMIGNDVDGLVVSKLDLLVNGGGSVYGTAAFVRAITLVR